MTKLPTNRKRGRPSKTMTQAERPEIPSYIPEYEEDQDDLLHTTATKEISINPGDLNKQLLGGLVSTLYQIQKLRIQTGNKLIAHFYRKIGIDAAEKMIEQKKGDKKSAVEFIDVLKDEYKRIADALSDRKVVREKNFKDLEVGVRGIFDEYAEYSWMSQYRTLVIQENNALKDVERTLNKFPIYTEWLKDIRGVGVTMAGVIICYIDIHKADTPASIWSYAGLDVVPVDRNGDPDGRGRGRFNGHLVEVSYVDRTGKDAVRDSVTFNPTLKTKLVGVLADLFIKMGTEPYRTEYDNYKERITQREAALAQQNGPDYKKRTAAHIHRMAMRYMIKRFLVDLYKVWRTLEGLEVVEEYGVRKLGLQHHQHGSGRWAQQVHGVNTPTMDSNIPKLNENDGTPESF